MTFQRGEIRWAIVLCLGLVVALYIPYIAGWMMTPPGYHYVWEVYNADEAAVYDAWMYQAMEGRWIFADLFTTEPQRPRFFNVFHLFWGKFSGLIFPASAREGVPTAVQYGAHFVRLFSNLFFFAVAYWFVSLFFLEVRWRRIAFFALAFFGGLGWLIKPVAEMMGFGEGKAVYYLPVDVSPGLLMPEATTFMCLLARPLFAFSMGLVMLVLGGLYLSYSTESWKPAFLAAGAALLLGNVHTYDLVPLMVITVLFFLLRWRIERKIVLANLYKTILILAACLPGLLYAAFVFSLDPIWRAKAETGTPSPPILAYILTYLVSLLLTVVVLVRWRASVKWQLLLLSVPVVLLLAYLPVSFQRKLIEVLPPILAVLSVGGLMALWDRWERSNPHPAMLTALVVIFFGLITPSGLVNLAHTFALYSQGGMPTGLPPYYMSSGQFDTLFALRENTRGGGAVLADPTLSAYVPGHTGLTVYVGHWAETLEFGRKFNVWKRFWEANISSAKRKEFCKKHGIRFLVVGPSENYLCKGRPPIQDIAYPIGTFEDHSLWVVKP